jgi:hypothetical protein
MPTDDRMDLSMIDIDVDRDGDVSLFCEACCKARVPGRLGSGAWPPPESMDVQSWVDAALAHIREHHVVVVDSVVVGPRDLGRTACRQMETRRCPRQWPGGCGERPCARFESDDERPWRDEYASSIPVDSVSRETARVAAAVFPTAAPQDTPPCPVSLSPRPE